MANEYLQKVGTQICFADHGADFAGGAAKTSLEQAGGTDVQLDLTSVANGSGRESAQVDLGATRPAQYAVKAAFELAATPVTGDIIELYWAASPDSTAANGNPMQIDGVDAAAPSGIGTLAELVKACEFIGAFVCTDDVTGTVQVGDVAVFSPSERYGILIVKNESGAAFHSDAVESHIVFNPIVDELQ